MTAFDHAQACYDAMEPNWAEEDEMDENDVKQRLLERIAAYQEGEQDAQPNNAILRARLGRTLEALMEVRRYALAVVGAAEAYGETDCAHLWQEVSDIADKALASPLTADEDEQWGPDSAAELLERPR